jgi:hypothetical protein
MARLTYLERRGAVYYARIDIPLDLVDHYGTTTRKKSLRTKDENVAKDRLWPVIEAWRAEFSDCAPGARSPLTTRRTLHGSTIRRPLIATI